MREEKPFNLFSGASNRSPKPKKEDVKPPNAAPASQELSQPIIDDISTDLLPDELKDMMNRMKHLHDELDKRLDEVYQQSGLNPKIIKNYLENPNNFTSEEWEDVQKQRKTLLSSIWQKLGRKEINMEKIDPTQSEQSSSKERKGKTLGARRNWISMK